MGFAYNRSSSTQLASATSANGTTRTTTTPLNIGDANPGSISFACQATIVTGSVVATFTPQVSMDASTWFDVKLPNNATNVTLSASGTIALPLGAEFQGWQYARCNALLSGAATASGDLTVVTARFVPYGMLPTYA